MKHIIVGSELSLVTKNQAPINFIIHGGVSVEPYHHRKTIDGSMQKAEMESMPLNGYVQRTDEDSLPINGPGNLADVVSDGSIEPVPLKLLRLLSFLL